MFEHDVTLVCDGSCYNHPEKRRFMGVGIVATAGPVRREWSVGLVHPEGTNNMAELKAIELALAALKDRSRCRVTLFTDSKWAIGALSGEWVITHHTDIVAAILVLQGECASFAIHHTPGHVPASVDQCRADRLASQARRALVAQDSASR